MSSLARGGVVVLFVLVLFLFLVCVWTSSLLHIYLLSNSSRSVDRPCRELDRQSLQKIHQLIVKQMETLLQNYCFETTCKDPERQNQYVY